MSGLCRGYCQPSIRFSHPQVIVPFVCFSYSYTFCIRSRFPCRVNSGGHVKRSKYIDISAILMEKLYFSGCNTLMRISTSYPIYARFYRDRETIKLLTCASFRLYSVKNKACTIRLTCYRFGIYRLSETCHRLHKNLYFNLYFPGDTAHGFSDCFIMFSSSFRFFGNRNHCRPAVYVICKLRSCPPHHEPVFIFACMGIIPTPYGVSS